MATANRYPLSSPEGQAIPLDVVKPLGVIRLPFTSASYNSQVLSSAYQDKLLMLSSSADCYLDSNAVAVPIVDNIVSANNVHVPAGTLVIVVINSVHLNVIGVSASGSLHVQILDTWSKVAIEAQISRI